MPDTKEYIEKKTKAMEEIFKRDGYFTPVLFIIGQREGKDGEMILPVVNEWMADGDKKRRFMFLAGKTAREEMKMDYINCIAFISEAWVSTNPDKDAKGDFLPASQQKNKKEVVVLQVMQDNFQNEITVFEMVEKGNAKKRQLKKIDELSTAGGEPELLSHFWRGLGTII